MATRGKKRAPAKKKAPVRRRKSTYRAAAAPKRRRRRKVSQKFDTVAKEALMLAAGQLAVDFGTDMVNKKMGDKLEKFTLGGKLDPVALVMGIVGTNLAKKRSKNRMLFMGIASGGYKKAVSGFIPGLNNNVETVEVIEGVGNTNSGYEDVAAMMLNEAGVTVNSIPRISGEDQMVNSIPRVSGISRQF